MAPNECVYSKKDIPNYADLCESSRKTIQTAAYSPSTLLQIDHGYHSLEMAYERCEH